MAPNEGGRQRTNVRVKLLWKYGSQGVRLSKEVQFATELAFIRKDGDDVLLSPHPKAHPKGLKWYLKHGRRASAGFFENRDDPPPEDGNYRRDESLRRVIGRARKVKVFMKSTAKPWPRDWETYVKEEPFAPDDIMKNVATLPDDDCISANGARRACGTPRPIATAHYS